MYSIATGVFTNEETANAVILRWYCTAYSQLERQKIAVCLAFSVHGWWTQHCRAGGWGLDSAVHRGSKMAGSDTLPPS